MEKSRLRRWVQASWPGGTRALAVVAAVLLLAAGGFAALGAQFASGVTLVDVYATVTDERGVPVANLQKGDFTISERLTDQSVSR